MLPLLLFLAQSDLAFPNYTAASISNTAANQAGLYAANTLISIYGSNLSAGTQAVGPADVRAGELPTSLGPASVRVLLNGQFAGMYFVSPTQVNALIPTNLLPGNVTLQVVQNGRAGPPVTLRLEESAPALFEAPGRAVIATHGNGPPITADSPAAPGEIVVLYATGLGLTAPQTLPNRIPTAAARLTSAAFQVWLNGIPVPRERILYAGVTPGFAGLFQVNLQLPADAPKGPEIRVGTPDRMSPGGSVLYVR